MKIVGAKWTPQVNMYEIECTCGKFFEARTDRWKVVCPKCGATGNTGVLREAIKPGDVKA